MTGSTLLYRCISIAICWTFFNAPLWKLYFKTFTNYL